MRQIPRVFVPHVTAPPLQPLLFEESASPEVISPLLEYLLSALHLVI